MKVYTATVRLLLPADITSPSQACDRISGLLTHYAETEGLLLDWAYAPAADGGLSRPSLLDVPEVYTEGDFL